MLVTGEPGVGKTVLLKAASEAASAAGTRVLRAAGVEFEAGMSFSGLNQVLLPLLTEVSKLAAVHRDALNVALGFIDGAPPDRLIVSNAALMLLREAAASRSLLVAIDDLPWLDRASAGVLSFVARRLEGSQIGLLGASRTGEVDFFERAGLPELEVLRLDDDASRRLLDIRFPDLTPGVRERILGEAQGIRSPCWSSRQHSTQGRTLPLGRCLRLERLTEDSGGSSDRGSLSYPIRRGNSCCSWPWMALEISVSWSL